MGSRLAVAVLRSPLHRLKSRREVAITVGGRTSAVPFSRSGDTLIVLGRQGDDWWTGLSREGTTPVGVVLAGTSVTGQARFVSGDALDDALIPYLHDHPGAWQDLAIAPNASADDVATAARQAAVIVIDLPSA